MKLKNLINAIFFVVVFVLFAFGCKQTTPGNTQATTTAPMKEALSIDTFSTFPPEIDGCACYVSSDSSAFNKGVYIYMNDYGKISILKINGVLTKFTETDRKEIGEEKTIIKSKSEEYEMTVEMVNGKQNGDETWLKTGTIKLSKKGSKSISKAFFGECGC